MKIYRLYTLRPREIRKIHESLGGKFGYKERLSRDGTGSPFLYYAGGHPEIDRLNERASDQLRINIEEFKSGLMVGISERTEPHILPLLPENIESISLRMEPEKVNPKPGSFFSWLLDKKVPLPFSRYFAASNEYEEPKVKFTLKTTEYPIHCWTMASAFNQLNKFLNKSGFRYLLKKD